MVFAPTPEQQQAITTMDRDVVVVAGAGSGKTKVLVERYLHLVDQGVPLDRIVAITFTRKAAQEMKDRIRSRLLAEDSWRHLADQLVNAEISTIHSYCQHIVAENPREIGIDPRFRLAEEWEVTAMLEASTRQVVEDHLVDEMVASHFRDLRGSSQIVAFLRGIYQSMVTKGLASFAIEDERARFQRLVTQARLELREALEYWLGVVRSYPLSLAKRDIVAQIASTNPSLAKDSSPLPLDEQLELAVELDEALKGNWGRLRQSVANVRDRVNQWHRAITDCQGHHRLMLVGELLEDVDRTYQERKRDQGLLDFHDLETLALRLLAQPDVRERYVRDHLMVDEYQDTNRQQHQIITHLCSPRTRLFVVGDPKQSIYRFRGAEVQVFLDTQREVEEGGGVVLSLNDNFRSQPGLVAFSNRFCGELFAQERITYHLSAARRGDEGGYAELLLAATEGLDAKDARSQEAAAIASRIHDLIDEGMQYRDVTVLLRRMTHAQMYEDALVRAGIPYVNMSGRGFYGRREIQDVLNYVRWLEDPEDQVAPFAVLRSPFFGVSEEGLYWHSKNDEGRMGAEDRRRIALAMSLYREFVRDMQRLPAPRFLEALLHRTNYGEQLKGTREVANVEKLLGTSWRLWNRGFVSMADQLQLIGAVMEQSAGEGEARLVSEHDDVVTLMTIHGSKGLEFPTVIMADLAGLVSRRHGDQIAFHPDFGLGYKGTGLYDQIQEAQRQEEVAEAKRLLYVAMTRAQDCLILAGPSPGQDESKSLGELSSYWQWIRAIVDEGFADTLRVREYPNPMAQWKHALSREVAASAGRPDGYASQGPSSTLLAPGVSPPQPLPAVEAKTQFSVTSLMVYAQCPRRYYYRYILRVPEHTEQTLPLEGGNTLSPLIRGNIVHRVCERIRSPKQKAALLKWSMAMEDVQLSAAVEQELGAIIDKYLASRFFQRMARQEVLTEVEFLLPLGDHLITGTIDQLVVEEHGVSLMDLKTNRITPPQVSNEAARYDWQLRIYCWASSELYGRVSEAQLYFLWPDVVYTHPVAHTLTEQTEVWLQQTCRQISEGSLLGSASFAATGPCRQCGYHCGHGFPLGLDKLEM